MRRWLITSKRGGDVSREVEFCHAYKRAPGERFRGHCFVAVYQSCISNRLSCSFLVNLSDYFLVFRKLNLVLIPFVMNVSPGRAKFHLGSVILAVNPMSFNCTSFDNSQPKIGGQGLQTCTRYMKKKTISKSQWAEQQACSTRSVAR